MDSQDKSPFALVYYFVPEDCDELKMPNAFAVNRQLEDVNLADIESCFPLEGEFIFRFKYKVNGNSVWLDLTNRKCKVPKTDGKIILKVTRKKAKYLLEPNSTDF